MTTEEQSENEAQAVETNDAPEVLDNAEIAIDPEIEDQGLKGEWYILHTYSMYEKKVDVQLQQAIERYKLQDKIFKIVVPEEETIEVKDGRRTERTRKLFPGYVFINMLLEDDVLTLVRRIPGVLKFVGADSRPEPVKDEEMVKVLRRIGIKAKRVEVDFEIGEVIKIIAGPFRGYTGGINEISADRGRLKTLISIFGRETPVELTFDQVEKTS